jgi:hypothetical protein
MGGGGGCKIQNENSDAVVTFHCDDIEKRFLDYVATNPKNTIKICETRSKHTSTISCSIFINQHGVILAVCLIAFRNDQYFTGLVLKIFLIYCNTLGQTEWVMYFPSFHLRLETDAFSETFSSFRNTKIISKPKKTAVLITVPRRLQKVCAYFQERIF